MPGEIRMLGHETRLWRHVPLDKGCIPTVIWTFCAHILDYCADLIDFHTYLMQR